MTLPRMQAMDEVQEEARGATSGAGEDEEIGSEEVAIHPPPPSPSLSSPPLSHH